MKNSEDVIELKLWIWLEFPWLYVNGISNGIREFSSFDRLLSFGKSKRYMT